MHGAQKNLGVVEKLMEQGWDIKNQALDQVYPRLVLTLERPMERLVSSTICPMGRPSTRPHQRVEHSFKPHDLKE